MIRTRGSPVGRPAPLSFRPPRGRDGDRLCAGDLVGGLPVETLSQPVRGGPAHSGPPRQRRHWSATRPRASGEPRTLRAGRTLPQAALDYDLRSDETTR